MPGTAKSAVVDAFKLPTTGYTLEPHHKWPIVVVLYERFAGLAFQLENRTFIPVIEAEALTKKVKNMCTTGGNTVQVTWGFVTEDPRFVQLVNTR